MGIDRDTRDGFLSEIFGFINEKDDISEINAKGKIINHESNSECDEDSEAEIDTIIQFADKWTKETFKYEKNTTEKIDNILLSDLVDNTNWNNKNEESRNYEQSQVIYDNDKKALSFSDESMTKYDPFGCMYEGTDEISLFNLVKELEVLEEFNRITDFGNIYDFQVKKISYGAYKFSNTRICSEISKFLGFFSIDKMINDEQIRQYNAGRFGHKYNGILVNEEYISDGWIDVDYLVQLSLQDDFGYDNENSLSINTKRFKDRKKALIYLLINYTCDIWSLNSKNKIVDFGIRIIDKTTSEILDYSSFSNGTNGEISYSGMLQYFGGFQPVDEEVNQPEFMGEECDKVLTNKCNGRHFRLSPISSLEEEDIESRYHEIMPQFKINLIKEAREDKKDIINTLDPVHWTTGIETLEQFAKDNNIEIDFIDDLIKEFGRTPFLCSYLVEDRAFHNGGGDFSDGICGGGYYHTFDPQTGEYEFDCRISTEKWNGTTWSLEDTTSPKFGLGISGGNSGMAAAGWGASASFYSTNPNYTPPSIFIYPRNLLPDSNVYLYKPESGWQVSKLNTVVNKFSCGGVINVKEREKTSFITIEDDTPEEPQFEWDSPEEENDLPSFSESRKRNKNVVRSISKEFNMGVKKAGKKVKRLGKKLGF